MAIRKSPLVRSLIDRYKQALSEETRLTEEFERASRALADLRETKKLCAALLRKEGFDVDSIEPEGGQPVLVPMPQSQTRIVVERADGATNGQPLNATHAVYMIFRRRMSGRREEVGTAPGYTAQEIERLSKEDQTPLTFKAINKVLWTQIKKKRMERLDGGRVRLTLEGWAFNNFRRKPAEEDRFAVPFHEDAINASTPV